MESSLDQFTFNSRPAAANFQPGCKDQGRPDKEQFKYTVIICNNTCSVCQYCHIKIKQQDLMLMTKSQRTTNDASNTPCFYGFHCDCFFLSSNVLKSSTELYGFNSLSKYHRHYIARKISKSQSKAQVGGSREIPGDLKVGYSILDRRFNHYCEQCNMAMLASDIKIAGILKKHSDLVVYHPRCFSQAFERHPVKLQGLEKLLPYDISGLKSILNIITTSSTPHNKYQSKSTPIENVMKFRSSKDAFFWPRANSSSGPANMEEQNTASSSFSSSSGDKIWDSLHPSRQQPPNNPSYKSRSKPSSFDDLIRNHSNRNPDSVHRAISNPPRTADLSRKRKTSFKPNTDHSNSRWSNHGSDPKKTANPPKREQSHESCRTSDSHSGFSKESDPETSEPSGKVELKKSTIRSEITKILYKYNHDYITSKIVRTMLMQKFLLSSSSAKVSSSPTHPNPWINQ
ncbi:uncharacterized protein LOC134820152 [Bolinopsis microptera]|uniref:uncharacterized protein LOC134820152 n=1 Tax=Bolinopsis microptera TaxID=2820187 RepID=UPI00307AF57A